MSSSPRAENAADASSASRKVLQYSCVLAAVLASIVLLPLLGHRTLAMWDEGIYAEVAREMVGGSALVPSWNYHPWFEKPPLLFWITAEFFRAFGITEFWARAASALSGVATVAVLHRFILRRFGLLEAWSGSIILLSTFGYLHVCRAGEMDALLGLGEIVAVIGLVLVDEERRSGWLLFWVGFAAALMTKGAASVVLVLALMCTAIAARWRLRQFGLMFLAGFGVFLCAVLPWHMVMWNRFGHEFTSQYFGLHVLARASSQIEGHYTHAWYYVIVLLVSAPPWVLLYGPAIVAAFRNPELRSLRILSIFALIVLVFFTVVETRLPHYIAPAYPALSAVTGVVLARWMLRVWVTRPSARARSGLILAAVAVAAVMILATAHGRRELHSPHMSNGEVTPDTHEPAALLKRAFHSPRTEQGPLLLLAEPPIAPITTALFYSRGPVEQVEIAAAQPAPVRDEYTWNPAPLTDAIGEAPRLVLIERSEIGKLPPAVSFTAIDSSAHWELGTIRR